MAENVGGSNIEITASSDKAESSFARFFKNAEGQGRKFKKTMDGLSPFEKFQQDGERFDSSIGKQLKNLPDHLKPFHKSLNETRREFRELQRQGTGSLEELADSAIKTQVALKDMTSVTKSGKDAIKIVDALGDTVKETRLAVMGLNKDGTMKISTEESENQMRKFRKETEKAKEELEKIRDAGDFASYNAGMEVLNRKMADVDKSFRAVSRGGQFYTKQLREMGIVTSDMANQSAIVMEAYKDKFLQSVDLMNARASQSSKMMKILPEVSSIAPVDKIFLKIGDSIEGMAKKGMAANLALEMLGKNASMKDINDRIMLINQGLMRMQSVALVAGIAFAAFTAAMFGAAKGPSPADVLSKQAEALAKYSEAVQDRTNEIASAWNLFEDIQLKKTSGAKLTKNLQEQVTALQNWRGNLGDIAQQAGTEFSQYLAKMGPEAAGEVAAIANMTRPELDKYVSLWREKHKLAKDQAVSELEGLKKATDRKVKELQDSLTPLGISLENFKKTWAGAAKPFIKTWGDLASKVVDAATSIGNFVNKMNEVNPQISAAAGMFMYLFTALTMILAPMAIGIGKAKGMRAAFSFITTTLKPLILGFLRIAGMASVVSGVLVALGLVFYNLWKNSEDFRKAVTNLWSNLKSAVGTAIKPLIKAFKTIGSEFVALINEMVGSKGKSMTSFWKTAGDAIAIAINKISDVIKALTPVFSVVFKIIGTVVVATFRNIVNIVRSGIAIITNIFGLFKNLATGDFKGAWGNIKAIFVNTIIFIWNYIQLMFIGRLLGVFKGFAKGGLSILKGGWTAIKTAGVTIFTAVRDFIIKMFTGLNSGIANISSKMSTGVLKIFSFLYNGARTIFGNILKGIVSIFKSLFKGVSGIASSLKDRIVSNWTTAFKVTSNIFKSVYNFIVNIFKSIFKSVSGTASSIKNAIVNAFKLARGSSESIFKNIYNFVANIFKSLYKSLSGTAKNIINGLKNAFNTAKTNTQSIFKSIYDYVVGRFSALYKSVTKAASNLKNGVVNSWKSAYKNTTSIFKSIYDYIVGRFSALYKSVTKTATNLKNGVTGSWKAAYKDSKNIYKAVYDFIVGRFSALYKTVTKTASNLKTGVTNSWNSAYKTSKSVFKSIYDYIVGRFTALYKSVTGKASSVRKGVSDSWNSLKKNTSSIFGSIWKNVSGIFTKMVNAAKGLPKRIGDGIRGMSKYAVAGAADMSKKVANGLVDGINKVTGGVNWVLEKIKVKTRLPKMDRYAKGTDGHPGGHMIVGDGKERELVRFPDGSTFLSPNTDTLVPNAPKGTQVLSGPNTKRLLKNVPKYASGVGNFFKGLLNKSLDVWDYISEPKKLLNKVLKKLNIPSMDSGGFLGKIATKGFSTVKDKAGDYIKDKMSDFGSFGGFNGAIPNVRGGILNWKPIILAAANKMGEAVSSREIQGILAQIMRESGGNQGITQSSAVVDVNTLSGNPARGLLQYIPQTFANYRVKGFNNIYSGFDQLLAFFNNKNWRRDLPYGQRGWSPRGARKFAKGGFFLDGPQMGLFGEGGPEMALPLIGKNMLPYSEAVAQNLSKMFSGNAASGTAALEITLHHTTEIDGRTVAKTTARFNDEEIDIVRKKEARFGGIV